jgi:hypothetical protein
LPTSKRHLSLREELVVSRHEGVIIVHLIHGLICIITQLQNLLIDPNALEMTKIPHKLFISYNDLIPRSFPIPPSGKAHMKSGRRIWAVSSAECRRSTQSVYPSQNGQLIPSHDMAYASTKQALTSVTGLSFWQNGICSETRYNEESYTLTGN